MATFGPISNPNPNVLFDPLAVDHAVAGMQRNRLMMQAAMEDRAQSRADREREEVGRISASLLALPAEARPGAYAAAVAELRGRGLASRAPEQYPGDAQIEMLARSALPATKQFELAEKQRASQEMTAMLGGMLGMGGGAAGLTVATAPAGVATGAAAPSAPPPVPGAPAAGAAVGGYNPNRNYAEGEARRAQVLGADPATLAGVSAAQSPVPQLPGGYRANPGVAGQNAGLPPPTGTINPMLGAALLMAGRTNPNALPGMLMAAQGQQAAAQERALDNARADAQFAAQERRTQQQIELSLRGQERQEALARLAAEREERQAQAQQRTLEIQAEKAKREAETVGVPSGYRRAASGALEPIPGGPADPVAQRGKPEAATEAERKAAGYLGRMQGAERLLEDMIRDGYDPGNIRDRVAGLTPGVGNFLSSEKGQQYMNAAAEWARAKLRLESGAVIGEEEAKAEARTYFPMPGDSAATIAQKARLRATAVEGVQAQAGRAAPAQGGGGRAERPPVAPAVGAVEGGYRYKGGHPGDPSSWERAY